MLWFNVFCHAWAWLGDSNFNTSYVVVQRSDIRRIAERASHFNTSYVVVQQLKLKKIKNLYLISIHLMLWFNLRSFVQKNA